MTDKPIFYITNDVARGIGIENLLPNYHIICLDDHPLVDYLVKAGVKVFCLERVLKQRNKIFRSTSKIIDHPLVLNYIQKESRSQTPQILFFKPSPKIDLICKKYGFNQIGNLASLNRQFEEKTLFYELCLKEGLPVPEGEMGILAKIEFSHLVRKFHLPLVIQFDRGWAGSTSYFIENGKQFEDLKVKFSVKKVKVVRFVKGKTILNNACIFQDKVIVGLPAQQINAIRGFTSLPGATCGRQWPANLEEGQRKEIGNLTRKTGKLMINFGYRGYFGLDFIIEDETGKIYLSENNARLTASTPFFSKLEQKAGETPLLIYHLFSFLNDKGWKPPDYQSRSLIGSEVVLRNDSPSRVKVGGRISPGVYRFTDNQFVFLRAEHFPHNLTPDEFWLDCADLGREVNPEIEIVRADFFKIVLGETGELEAQIVSLLKLIKKQLKLKEC